jgi:hypothetical protein
VQKRNDSWVTLAARVFGLPERDLRDNIALGDDSVLLAILLHVTRQFLRSGYYASDYYALEALSKLDIRDTLPRLQHDFCTIWNEIVQQARDQEPFIAPVYTLKRIRCLYIALHYGTNAAPTAFSASTDDANTILLQPSSYPFCDIASPHAFVPFPTQPDYNSMNPFSGYDPLATITSEIGATSHGPDMTPPTNPVRSNPHPTGASPTAVVAAAPQDITSTATLSHPLEGREQQDSDIVAQSAETGAGQILSTTFTHPPTPTLTPIPTPLSYTPSELYDAGVASVSNPSHFAPPSIGSSIPASRLTGSTTLPCLRVSLPIQPGNSPDESSRSPSRSGSIVSQRNVIAGPPFPSDSTTTSEIGEASQDLSAVPHAFPINSGPPLAFAFPPAADIYDGKLRDSHDQNQTIPMTVFHHRTQSLRLVPSPPDTSSNSLKHEGD